MNIKLCKKCNSVLLHYGYADKWDRYGYYCCLCEKWEDDND